MHRPNNSPDSPNSRPSLDNSSNQTGSRLTPEQVAALRDLEHHLGWQVIQAQLQGFRRTYLVQLKGAEGLQALGRCQEGLSLLDRIELLTSDLTKGGR